MKVMLVLAVDKVRLVSASVWAVAIVINLVWAATPVSTQVLLRTFSPFEIQFMRYLIAWMVLGVVGHRFWCSDFRHRDRHCFKWLAWPSLVSCGQTTKKN